MQLLALILTAATAVNAIHGPLQRQHRSAGLVARQSNPAAYQAYTIDQPVSLSSEEKLVID